jgi:hypothetical protein
LLVAGGGASLHLEDDWLATGAAEVGELVLVPLGLWLSASVAIAANPASSTISKVFRITGIALSAGDRYAKGDGDRWSRLC